MGPSPPTVALGVAHAEPARLPACLAIADSDFDWLHFDVADGTFVPRTTAGVLLLELARTVSLAPLDVHLLSARPEPLVAPLAAAGAGVITIHPAACASPREVLAAIRAAGARPGVAIDPAHGFDSVRALLPEVDVLLVATASTQFDGSPFEPATIARVQMARAHREREGLQYRIEVEGALALANVPALRAAGADVFVVGEAVFAAGDPAVALAMFRAAARNETLLDSPDGVTRSPAPPTRIRYLRRAGPPAAAARPRRRAHSPCATAWRRFTSTETSSGRSRSACRQHRMRAPSGSTS